MSEAVKKNDMGRNDPGYKAWFEKINRGVDEGMKDYEEGRFYTEEEMAIRLEKKYKYAQRL